MAKVSFTAGRVDGYKCEDGKAQTFLWDAKTPGLALRATKAGAKSYIFQGKLHGSTIRITIGDPRSWTIDQAQARARDLQTQIDKGLDPREFEAAQKAALEERQVIKQRAEWTVLDAWNDYLEALRTTISPKTKKPRSARYIEDHVNLAAPGGDKAKRGNKIKGRGPLWPLMTMRLVDLTSQSIADWLGEEIKRGPTNAAHAFALLKAFTRWCTNNEQLAQLVVSDPCNSVKVTNLLPKAKAKDDCLQREQLAAWFSAVLSIQNPVISTYLQGLLITGARREELAALRWEHVDLRWRSLTINDKVEGTGGRTIPLTPYFAELLHGLKALNETPPGKKKLQQLELRGKTWEPSPWVFYSKTSADGKIVEPRIAHNEAIQAAELPHITLHGLRRSFGTLAEWVEVPVGVVAQIQGHKPSAIAEKHYRRRPLDLLRMWHDKIETWMLEQAGIPFQSTMD
jgi:integrase